MDLKQYEQAKFGIAEILRTTKAADSKDETFRSGYRELLTRLAEDRFNLLVVGRFNRGKSTLLNALLGGNYLPTGIVPLTSVITTVRYGTRKQVFLNFYNSGSDKGVSGLRKGVQLSQLADYVTQQSNPGNIKNIAYAEIELPVEILRRGFFFVDSPGLGSPIIENTQTTERFLPEADAFILVTSYESPLSEEEDRILHRIRYANKKLFVVVNKHDTVSAAERTEVLRFVKERIEKLGFAGEPQIFSISARLAAEAAQSTKKELLDESGLRPFQTALLQFLTEERAELFLANMYERSRDYLRQWARSINQQEDVSSHIWEQLSKFREMYLGSMLAKESEIEVREEEQSSLPGTLQIHKRTGCRVCGAVLDAIFHFLSKYQYELSVSAEAQRDHANRGGFCPLHTWQYENISSPYGVCTSYPELAYRIAKELKVFAVQANHADGSLEEMRDLLPTTKTCRVCEVRISAERTAVAECAEQVRQLSGAAGGQLPACCLPHLISVVATMGEGEPARQLLKAHAFFFERTAEDLQRYALKHDALRRYLTSEEDRQAAQLILLLLAGHRSIHAPWSIEVLY